jgi:hypothetical protein
MIFIEAVDGSSFAEAPARPAFTRFRRGKQVVESVKLRACHAPLRSCLLRVSKSTVGELDSFLLCGKFRSASCSMPEMQNVYNGSLFIALVIDKKAIPASCGFHVACRGKENVPECGET